MSAIAFLQKMLDAGLPLDMAMKAAAAHEEETALACPTETPRQARNRRYYEAKQRLKASENVLPASESVLASESPSSPAPSPRPPTPPTPAREITTTGARASRRCPEGWAPSAADLAVGGCEGFNPGEIERELSKFRDHTFATARTDWSATFRNWLRNAKPAKPNERNHHNPSPRDDRIGRMLAGAVAAADG